jgi:hypothetical protein
MTSQSIADGAQKQEAANVHQQKAANRASQTILSGSMYETGRRIKGATDLDVMRQALGYARRLPDTANSQYP